MTYDTIGTAGDPAPRVHSSNMIIDRLLRSELIEPKAIYVHKVVRAADIKIYI